MSLRIKASNDTVLAEIKNILSLKIENIRHEEDKILRALREVIAINEEIKRVVEVRGALIKSREKFLVLRAALSHVPELLYYIDEVWHRVSNLGDAIRYAAFICELTLDFHNFIFEKTYIVETNDMEEERVKNIRYKLSDDSVEDITESVNVTTERDLEESEMPDYFEVTAEMLELELKSPPQIEAEKIVEIIEIPSDEESKDEEMPEGPNEPDYSPIPKSKDLDLPATTNIHEPEDDIPDYHFEVEIDESDSESEDVPAPISTDVEMETNFEEHPEEDLQEDPEGSEAESCVEDE
ncbi:uncharacterized protein LOC133038686 [Cannabis sativa]|uniref:uncharacterized protein LOC133038686 n=1 Tax=Cannabis sativa TaxID=3483 RepID=UPI0029CA56DC|nr:uncharacterized protein LOC133038686 [Cannabis sativa]